MSKIYVITGGATGIGAAVKEKLLARGDTVIVIDIKNADVIADLSTAAGRRAAIAAINDSAPRGIDGLVPCAGLGPSVKPYELITRVNYFGCVSLIQGLQPLLQLRQGTVVVISSNSAALPGHNKDYVKALLEDKEDLACAIIAGFDGQAAYGGSKFALAVWMRKHAPGYMRDGVRMNAVAPGITQTAMTDAVFRDPAWGNAIRQFNDMTPCGKMASPDMIANTILFLLDPASEFVCGSVLFVDGGTDALLRPENF
jgi:NAD(P)-dependent dehydrogenase (short-subunit alcohol dehydrogenase family)